MMEEPLSDEELEAIEADALADEPAEPATILRLASEVRRLRDQLDAPMTDEDERDVMEADD